MAETALTRIEQKSVLFYDDEMIAALAEDGNIYAPVSRLCWNLGIITQSQTRRIRRHAILGEGLKSIAIEVPSKKRGGGQQVTLCLRVDLLPLWLAGIETNKVRRELREKLTRYQRECALILWNAFRGDVMPANESAVVPQESSPAAQAYQLAMAVANLARQQMLFEQRLDEVDSKIIEHEEKLASLELRISPGEFITAEQAMQVSQAVKTIAMKLSQKSGRNEYGSVYGQLYRRAGIVSYKQLPIEKFDEIMVWLREWYSNVTGATGGDVPF